MIITEEKNTLETSIKNKASVFTIENNPKVFKLLSKSLYEDSIVAIVREISCNAYDAHVEANRLDIPFEVTFPNRFNPYFEVKDFGNGLTELEILGNVELGITGLYNSYFKSSKNNTDKQIGGWGLGSKSPFSYSSQFSVESRQNGICKFYSCFENEESKPSAVKMGESPTEEKDGLTVKIPVNRQDFHSFVAAGERTFKFWENKPILRGAGLNLFKPEYDIKEKNFGILKNSDNKLNVIVNNVNYQVKNPNDKLSLGNIFLNNYGKLLNKTVIFADISDVDVTLSRDNLEYTSKTTDFLNKNLKETEEFLVKDFNEKIKNAENLNEAYKIRENHPYDIDTFIFNGEKISGKFISHIYDVKDVDVTTFYAAGERKKKYSRYAYEKILSFAYFKKPVIKIDEQQYKSKLRKFLQDNNLEYCYITKGDSLDEITKKYFNKIILSSSLPSIPKEKRERTCVKKCSVYNGDYSKRFAFDEVDVDITKESGLFITSYNLIKGVNRWSNIRNVLSLVKKITKKEIYKFQKGKEKILLKNGWISVEDKIDEILKDVRYEETEKYNDTCLIDDSLIVDKIYKDYKLFSGKLKDFLEEYKNLKEKKITLDSDIQELFYIFNNGKDYDFKNKINISEEYYGISRFAYDNKEIITNYILMVDKWRKSGKLWK